MKDELSPQRWANTLTTVLNAFHGTGPERFPVKVPELAKDFSLQRFPTEPIALVLGDSLGSFDGALHRGGKGWGIFYNNAISSPGRIRFTQAHEFGHYLLHRLKYPEGLQCGEQDMVRWDSEYARIETQANEFAATLLMPLDDFRRQIEPRAKPTLDEIGDCANRYGVSLIAATLRWLQYTERRSVLVVSRDGFILWARSSAKALKTGAFFRTADRAPVSIPGNSLAARPDLMEQSKGQIRHDGGVWFKESCDEVAVFSDQYDFTLSLLHLEAAEWRDQLDADEEEDAASFIARVNDMR